MRFFLVFNSRLKVFHYILDETVTPVDVFVPAPVGHGRILIGKRTGFALYRDQQSGRKILIGVFRDNVAANNYIDGPFDQMPDNFIVDDSYRDAILAVEPDVKDQINRYGSFPAGARFAVEPYMECRSPEGPRDFRPLRHQPAHPAEAARRLLLTVARRPSRPLLAAARHAGGER